MNWPDGEQQQYEALGLIWLRHRLNIEPAQVDVFALNCEISCDFSVTQEPYR